MRKPFFRSDVWTWYLQMPGGKQVNLGKDERYSSPPKLKPKEPPPSIQKKYLAAMQSQAESEDRKLSFCAAKYLESLADCEPNSIRRSKHYVDRFVEATGDPKVSKLKSHHVTEFLKGKDWSDNTVRQVIITINACLNHCVRQDWIDRNPIKGKVAMPLAHRREDIMSAEDGDRLIQAAPEPFKTVLVFLAGTGCRPIEARELLIEKIDLDKGIAMVPNKTRKQTGNQERPVFLSTAMIGLVRAQMLARTEGNLFLNPDGNPWEAEALRKRMERLCEKIGVTYGARLYSSRHNFISDAINKKGIPAALVAIQSGHKDLKMLMNVYLHHDHAAMRRELDKS